MRFLRLGVVQAVEALDDAGFDGPAAVERGQAIVLGLRPLVEPLLAHVVVLGEIVLRMRLQRRDGVPALGRHGVMLFDVAMVVDAMRQKSSVVPLSGSYSSSTRWGQSAALMSQKRHSWRLGTRLAGSSPEIRRISAPRFWMNWSSTASTEMRTVWSR